MRADQLLVARGLAPTRSTAQRLIERGAVRWRSERGWAVPRKSGEELPSDAALEVTDDAELRYASRGGLMLAGALDRCGLDVRGLVCLDAGQGTGGFTDVLLARGAAKVVGIDVGRGQLHPRLAADARVVAYEGVNARDADGSAFAAEQRAGSFDLVVADLSFISLTLALPALARWAAASGELLLLVKPQFELQPEQIGKGGLVRDPALHAAVEARIRDACRALSLAVRDYFASPIAGGDGNAEFFVRAQPLPSNP